MKRRFFRLITGMLAILLLFAGPVESEAAGSPDGRQELNGIIQQLSSNQDRFEALQKKLEHSGRNNRNYDEQKNMWISAVIAISTVATICEYENELLTLFLDLRPERRPYFYDVRIQSLETSIRQIQTMKSQIRINFAIITTTPEEMELLKQINLIVDSSAQLLTRSLVLINRMKTSPK